MLSTTDGALEVVLSGVVSGETKIFLVTENGCEEECVMRLARIGLDTSIACILKNGIRGWADAKLGLQTAPRIKISSESDFYMYNDQYVIVDIRAECEKNRSKGVFVKNMPYAGMKSFIKKN